MFCIPVRVKLPASFPRNTFCVPNALMIGVPARQAGWISRHGYRLADADARGILVCPYSGLRYREEAKGRLVCLDAEENGPLPQRAQAA